MDKSSLSKTIMDTINEPSSNSNTLSNPLVNSSASEGTGFFGYIASISITTWIIIIIILAFLGFNIFTYLAKGSQEFTDFFKPIVSKIMGIFGMIGKQTVNTTATGAKGLADVASNTLGTIEKQTESTSKTQSENTVGKKANSSVGGTNLSSAIPQPDIMEHNALNQSLNKNRAKENVQHPNSYMADDSTSNIQKSNSKGGYCYIGEDRGHRSCMPVNENDACMSGDIFPTQELCINPNLRS
jgi:hypothetical protein